MKSLFSWIFRRKLEDNPSAPSVPPPVASEPSLEERLGWLRNYMGRDIATGFYGDAEILQNAQDVFEDEFDPKDLAQYATAMLSELLAEQAAAERDWPVETDCDRLDAAFNALDARGIVARQNFSCCGTCGAAEIWDEIQAADEAGGVTRGYAFYHSQDTENAAEGYGLYLNYGASKEGKEAALTIAHEIVEELERHGLATNWDGALNRRIGISLDWKRRRVQASTNPKLH